MALTWSTTCDNPSSILSQAIPISPSTGPPAKSDDIDVAHANCCCVLVQKPLDVAPYCNVHDVFVFVKSIEFYFRSSSP